jgi:hypothetical protein
MRSWPPLQGFVLDLERIEETRVLRKAFDVPIETVLEDTGFEHTERVVPGPKGSPEITLSIVSDPGASKSAPCVYYMHGGGMVMGDRFVGVRAWVPWIQRFGVTVVSSRGSRSTLRHFARLTPCVSCTATGVDRPGIESHATARSAMRRRDCSMRSRAVSA